MSVKLYQVERTKTYDNVLGKQTMSTKNSTGEMDNIFVTRRFNCSVTCNMHYCNVCGSTRQLKFHSFYVTRQIQAMILELATKVDLNLSPT
jgi:hypothetical protein